MTDSPLTPFGECVAAFERHATAIGMGLVRSEGGQYCIIETRDAWYWWEAGWEAMYRATENQPAVWSQDSSLETWFPLTAKTLNAITEALRSAIVDLEYFGPSLPPGHVCGPESQCDGLCMDAASFSERLAKYRQAIP